VALLHESCVFLGVGTAHRDGGERARVAGFEDRFARLREAVELKRQLGSKSADRCTPSWAGTLRELREDPPEPAAADDGGPPRLEQ